MANEIAQLEYSKATAVGVAKLNESIAKVDTKITDIIKLKKAEPKSPIRTISSPKIGFDFKGFQTRIGNIFTSGARAFTTPLRNFRQSFSSSISRISSMFSNLNPFKAIGAIKEKFTNMKNTVKKFVSKDIDKIKNKFFENWYNPAKVAAIQWWVGHNLCQKENKKNLKKIEKTEIKRNNGLIIRISTKNELEDSYYRIWNKPAKVANIWAKEFNKELKFKDKKYKNIDVSRNKELKFKDKKYKGIEISRNKELKKDKKYNGQEASQNQVFVSIAKSVNKIASAVTWFFTGPGFGIGLAIGLTPPILLLSAAIVGAVWLICDTIEKLVTPLIDPVKDILSSIGTLVSTVTGIASKILSIFDSPISAVAKGVKGVVNKVGEMLSPEEPANNIMKVNFEPITTLLNGVVTKFNKSFITPFMKSFDVLSTKTVAFFEKEEMKKETSLPKATLDKLSDMTQNIMSKSYNAAKGVYKDLKNSLSNLFSSIKDKSIVTTNKNDNAFRDMTQSIMSKSYNETKGIYSDLKSSLTNLFSSNKDKSIVTAANNDNNAFSEMTKSFNDMKNESIVILEQIKTAVIDISKNRVQVNPIANVGNATTTDNKLQTPLNVVVNNPTQGELLDAIKSINTGVMSIVKNTALDESGKFKSNADAGGVWAID